MKTFINFPLLSLTPSHDRMPLKLEGCCSVLHIFVVQVARTQRHMPMGTIQHHWCWWGMLISIWNNKRYVYAPEGRYCGFSYPHTAWQEFSHFMDIHLKILQCTLSNTKKRAEDSHVFSRKVPAKWNTK